MTTYMHCKGGQAPAQMSPDKVLKFEREAFNSRRKLGLSVAEANRGLTNKFN